ncbi:BspA family leucine-rich repeat surface protein [Bifidobacterium sp. ESL0763]|uniref:BspA family leucine-rich repeat surface protein n=1 Tax=Bifidobacterium sp. ESL0763 TaxID=2983227 RepID=UPI0023F8988E|nr:BspA family leucine-rich repeat surface protein [Bifidobacterium sp. ESL0763]MDF7663366.1 BspA family leucine-rich repeat surface protein [Bifidobacterium sp. ESL0763]
MRKLKRWEKSLVGLVVASSLAIVPTIASASATGDEASNDEATAQQSGQPSQAPKPAGVPGVSPETPKPATAGDTDAAAADSASKDGATKTESQTPQVQSDPAAQSGEQGSCDNEEYSGGAHITFADAGDGTCMATVGAGTIQGQAGDGPWNFYRDNAHPAKPLTRIRFTGAVTVNGPVNQLFENMGSLKEIDGLEKVDTSNVTDMSQMFEGDKSLTEADGLSAWDTSKVTDMNSMFDGAGFYQLPDLSSWDTSRVTNMTMMFNLMPNLRSVGDLSGWNVSKVTTMVEMFRGCAHLDGVGSSVAAWHPDSLKNAWQMFMNDTALTSLDLSGWKTNGQGTVRDLQITNMQEFVSGDSHLSSLTGMNGWQVPHLNNLSSAFSGISVQSLDFTGWHPVLTGDALVETFYGDSSLRKLNLNGWNTAAVTSMRGTFLNDSSLSKLDLSNWETGSVTNMYGMFGSDGSLKRITGLGDWDVSGVQDMSFMFYNDVLFEYGNEFESDPFYLSKSVAKWHVSAVTNMDYMFCGVLYMRALDLSQWDTSHVTSMKDALPDYINKLTLGGNTKLMGSAFRYQPSAAQTKLVQSGEQVVGYTGRWTDDSNKPAAWVSDDDDDDDNASLADQTQANGFAGGTYGWQQWAKVAFNGGRTGVTGHMDTATVTAMDVSQATFAAPANPYTLRGYKFDKWVDNFGEGVHEGELLGNFIPGETVTLMATWIEKPAVVPAQPIIPLPGITVTTPLHVDLTPVHHSDGTGTGNNQQTLTRGVRLPAPSPVAAPSVIAAPQAAGSDNVVTAPKKGQARPKCVPASVAKRMGRKVQAASWSDSDYAGLPQCNVTARSASVSTTKPQMNWWWLLLFAAAMVAIYLYQRHDSFEPVRHRSMEEEDGSRI